MYFGIRSNTFVLVCIVCIHCDKERNDKEDMVFEKMTIKPRTDLQSLRNQRTDWLAERLLLKKKIRNWID